MRVSTITRVATGLLLAQAFALAVILYWGLQALDAPYRTMQDYSRLKEGVSIDLRHLISRYLDNGDALQLQAATDHLQQLRNETESRLPKEMSATLLPLMDELNEGLTVKFRAAGKLSGSPQALLQQAERELNGSLGMLADYAREGQATAPADAFVYIQGAQRLGQGVMRLAALRDGGAEVAEVEQESERLLANLEELAALPRLGLYEETEEDPFAAMLGLDEEHAPAEERGDLIIAELRSLLQRYPQEWRNTAEVAQLGRDSRAAIEALNNRLEESVRGGEVSLLSARQTIVDGVQRWFVAVVILLALTALGQHRFLRQVVLKALSRLHDALQKLLESDEFQQLDVRNPNSEFGEVTQLFNRLLQRLEDQRSERTEQLHTISQSLAEMLAQIDHIHRITVETKSNVDSSQNLMGDLQQLALQVKETTEQVESYSQQTEGSMQTSQVGVEGMLNASRDTTQAVTEVHNSLQTLRGDVASVGTIVDVMKSVVEKVNLLALNAAIEAARAGEHGRGFSVVADEVRKLAQQTQGSLGEIEGLLGQLQGSTTTLNQKMEGIQAAASHQETLALQLLETARGVRDQSQHSSDAARRAAVHVSEQSAQVDAFREAMEQMGIQVIQAAGIVEDVRSEIHDRVQHISSSLGLEQEAWQQVV